MDIQPRFTRLSKVLSGVLLVLCATAVLAPSSRAYLCLVPGRTIPCVWNLLTAGFVSTNIVEGVVAIVSLLLLARLIEPVYGSTEFLKFILVVQLAASAATFVLAYLVFICVPQAYKGKTLYTEFSGFHGILAGLLVAVKQIMPHQEVILGGLLRLSTRFVPGLYVLAASALALLLRAAPALAFLWFGASAAWLYLRFLRPAPEGGASSALLLVGDASEDFRFSSFFPDALAPPLDAVGGLLARLLRLHPHGGGGSGEAKPLLPTHLLGSNSADATRRRERGVRALQERLEMKQVAEAPIVESAAAAAAAAAASALPEVPPATPQQQPDV